MACCDQEDLQSVVVNGTLFTVPTYLRIEQAVGVGAYGIVASAINQKTNEKVAIKKICDPFGHGADYAHRILREIRVLKYLRGHENIVRLVDVVKPHSIRDFGEVYLVTELVDDTLRNVLAQKVNFSEQQTQYVLYQLLRAAKHMHSVGIVHRDIKPVNVLMNDDWSLKLCDFGLARSSVAEEKGMSTAYVCTRWYRAPELLLGSKTYDAKVDMWGIGCILAELLQTHDKRKVMFAGRNHQHQLDLVLEICGTPVEVSNIKGNEKAIQFVKSKSQRPPKNLKELFPNASPLALDLLSKLLIFNPAQRISAEEALRHPFLQSLVDDEELNDEEEMSEIPTNFGEEPKQNVSAMEDLRKLLYDEVMNFEVEEIEEFDVEADDTCTATSCW